MRCPPRGGACGHGLRADSLWSRRYEDTNPSQLAALQLLWAHHVSSGKDDVRVSNVWLDSFLRHDDQVRKLRPELPRYTVGLRWHLLRPQSESAKFTAFYAFPLVETVELLVCTRLLPPCWQWPHSSNCSAGVSAPAVACRRHKTVCCPAGNRAECAASGSSFGLPAGLRGLSPSWDSPIGRARRGSVGVSRSKVFRPANPGLRGQRCLQVYRAAAMPRRPPVCRRI